MKFDHYTVIDVELANFHPDSICQIAIQEVLDGQVVFEASSLINPQTKFSSVCVGVHGIEYSDVKDAPTFAQYWPTIKEHCLNTVLVAHNAIFDVSALNASLEKYHIFLDNNFTYVCTMLLAKRLLPERAGKSRKKALLEEEPNSHGFGLASLCQYYHIDMLKHHDAFSDVVACRCLLQKLLENGGLIAADFHEFRRPISEASAHNSAILGQRSSRTLPKIGQSGVRYCLTGKFSSGSRASVTKIIEEAGGIVNNSVQLDTDYLIVGNKQGTLKTGISAKEKKAKQMIEQGYSLAIISEEEFLQGLKFAKLGQE